MECTRRVKTRNIREIAQFITVHTFIIFIFHSHSSKCSDEMSLFSTEYITCGEISCQKKERKCLKEEDKLF
jgi:hypothetical protein